MLLATDLDGTFLGGELHYREQLYNLIKVNKSIQLVFVTGRGLESILPLFNDGFVPKPNYIICDVGATILNGKTYEPVEPLQENIKKNWTGTFNILQHFKNIDWLQYQQVPQQRRCSFFLKDVTRLQEIKKLADEINCDVLYSASKFLDILPKGVNKGSSLTNLIHHLQIPADKVLVAGDTLNDLAMYHAGFSGVAVGASEEALLKATKELQHTYHAATAGAGGILEAMGYFDKFRPFIQSTLNVV